VIVRPWGAGILRPYEEGFSSACARQRRDGHVVLGVGRAEPKTQVHTPNMGHRRFVILVAGVGWSERLCHHC